ncbi:tol-pal system-associated acyl-CoA thioesterase [Alteromonadaceae bacterium M269]|nr:tol-pal system-associated acyl-CoA thioesterase [Alteromonadaceae bacterium M269]
MKSIHSLPIRVYYEDTDAGGIVYYANYLKFFERARTEWLRELGFSQSNLLEQSVGFVVKRVEMENVAPARFDQLLEVRTEIDEVKRASLLFRQKIIDEKQKTLVNALVRVACVDLDKMKPIAIPQAVREELSGVI